jgi:hypothetical protein
VEDCKSISIDWFKNNGYVSGRQKGDYLVYSGGGIRWSNYTGEYRGSIGFRINMINRCQGTMTFDYTITDPYTHEKEDLSYPVSLTMTNCYFGGHRWWFRCPLSTKGVKCDNRVATLHIPPNGKYFGCRHCYNLTYESCKESHKYDSLATRLGLTFKQLKRLNI